MNTTKINSKAPNGSGYVRIDGYKVFNINYKNILEHRLIVEKVLSKPLPKGATIHHLDENRNNNVNKNLVVCQDRKYHALLHTRMRAYRATGNVNCRKCPYCHQHDDPKNMYYEHPGRFIHSSCKSKRRKRGKKNEQLHD